MVIIVISPLFSARPWGRMTHMNRVNMGAVEIQGEETLEQGIVVVGLMFPPHLPTRLPTLIPNLSPTPSLTLSLPLNQSLRSTILRLCLSFLPVDAQDTMSGLTMPGDNSRLLQTSRGRNMDPSPSR